MAAVSVLLSEIYSALIDVMLVETATRISLIVADCIIILVTRFVTHSHRRESLSRVFSTRMGIASVLYKYGMNLVTSVIYI